MDQKRRDLLKASAAAVMGSAFASSINTRAEVENMESLIRLIPPLAGQVGLRLVTFIPKLGASHRIGVVLNDGRLVDISTEAAKQKMKLTFDPASMISLVASGDKGLAQAIALSEKASLSKKGLVNVNEVNLLSPIPKPQSNIYAVGWNYLEHFEEGKEARADKNVRIRGSPDRHELT